MEGMVDLPFGAPVTLEQLRTNPHPVLARLREHEPVSWVPVLDGWLVTRRDLVLRVMRDPETFTVDDPRFSTARVVGPSMLSLDGAEHLRHREPFDSAFGLPLARDRFAGVAAAESSRLVGAIEPAGAAELRRSVAGPLAVAVVADALGLAEVSTAEVLSWYDAIVAAVSGVAAGREVSPAGREAFGRLREQVQASVRGRGGCPTGDSAATTSLLAAAGSAADVAAGAGHGLRTDEIVSNAAVLMFGGIETTEGMICNAVWHLLTHPDQLALVRAQPDLLANAVEESLRLEPAASVVDRYATSDVELAGTPIRQGDLVVVSLAAANRDPAAFADPDAFDVRRTNARQHLAFAHGPHVCLGMHVARIEARTCIATLLDRLPGLRLDPERRNEPQGLVFRKPRALHTVWDTM
jgi:cytochrome P450